MAVGKSISKQHHEGDHEGKNNGVEPEFFNSFLVEIDLN
jgi:hypothetical protein